MTCLSPTPGGYVKSPKVVVESLSILIFSSRCIPCNFPFAQVTMTCPPPICLPIKPEPVKPLQLPCPQPVKVEIVSTNPKGINDR